MCIATIMAVASFAVSAASAVTGYIGQMDAANQQNRMAEQNRLNALQTWRDKDAAMGRRQQQEQESAAQERFDTQLEARKARATHEVAAGESGASGLSIEGLLREFAGREARYNDRVDQQLDWTMNALQDTKRGYGYEAVDRINAVPRARKPSFIDAGLKIASGAMNSYALYDNLSNRNNNNSRG